jgi:hypothetical protein
MRLSFINVPRWCNLCFRQNKSSPDGKSSHMLLTLLYLKAVFRNYYLTFGQCAYVTVKIIQNYLNEAHRQNFPRLLHTLQVYITNSALRHASISEFVNSVFGPSGI